MPVTGAGGAGDGYRLFTATDGRELFARIDAARERFTAVAAATGPAVQLRSSAWTSGEAAAHVLTVLRRYTRRDLSSTDGLAATPRELDRLNAVELNKVVGMPWAEILEEIDRELDEVHQLWPADGLDLHQEFPFHGGVMVDLAAALSNLIGELLIHGLDIAVAARRPWPIRQRDAVLVLNGVVQAAPAYAKRSATAELLLMLRVHGATPWVLQFGSGELVSRPAEPDEQPDVVLRTPATTLLLALYQRTSALQALTGGLLVVGGRRPWRIRHFNGLLEQP